MKNIKTILSIFLIIALAITVFTGCNNAKENLVGNQPTADPQQSDSPTEEPQSIPAFNYSDSIDENGLWRNITATDHVGLSEYKGISIPKEIHTISEESLQAEIDALLTEFASEEQVKDRAVVDGDTVNIDYVGTVDGVAFDEGSTNGSGADVTIGVTRYIDDFLEQIVGHTPGETFDIEVRFPEDYGVDALNGKEAVFATTLNYIVDLAMPALTDQFVADELSTYYGWSTIREMEADIRTSMQNAAIFTFIQSYLIENTTIKSLPESILKYQQNTLIQFYQDNADEYKMELNDFLMAYANFSNVEELLEAYLDDSTQAAELYLTMQAIAEDAGITVATEDVAGYFKEHMGTEDYSSYEESFGMPYLKLSVLNQAVMDHLQSNADLE